MSKPRPNVACWQNHLGAWAIEPSWMQRALVAVQAGHWRPDVEMARLPRLDVSAVGREVRLVGGLRSGSAPAAPKAWDDDGDGYEPFDPYAAGYVVTDGGVAVLELLGPLMKARSKYGGSSTVGLRAALRAAVADETVSAIMLHIESPGGSVAGTPELADAIAAANKQKPVHAYIEDLGASAAVWAGFQARRVTANATAHVGSIGVFSVLYDLSKAFDEAGLKVHVLSTGPDKGTGVEGAPITDAQLEPYREFVAYAGGLFNAAVQRGRGLTDKRLAAVVSGRTWAAPAALELFLIDAVEGWQDALEAVTEAGTKARKGSAPRAARPRAAALAARLVRVRAAALGVSPAPAPKGAAPGALADGPRPVAMHCR